MQPLGGEHGDVTAAELHRVFDDLPLNDLGVANLGAVSDKELRRRFEAAATVDDRKATA